MTTTTNQNQTCTGYPSIDRPWLKHYPQEAITDAYIDTNIYSHIRDRIQKGRYERKTAINFYGNKISYSALMDKVDDLADILYSAGIRKGDKVSLCLPTLPETIYLFLAINKIGAIANFIDPRINTLRIKECIGTNTKYLFSVEEYNDKIAEVADELGIKNKVEVSAVSHLPIYLKCWYLAKHHRQKDNSFTLWNTFCAGKKSKAETVDTKSDDVAAIVYTSGTTGVPKGAMLTNGGICSICFQQRFVLPDMTAGDTLLDIMPPFLAYGLGCGICAPLSAGLECQLIPNFQVESFAKLVKRRKPNHIIGVPYFFEKLAGSLKRNKEMAYIKYFIAGGDKMTESSEKMINHFIEEHHIKNRIVKGYGMTELSGGALINICNGANELGSVGQPLCRNNIMIRDVRTGAELPYGTEGEIYITGPSLMKGYVGCPEEEASVFVTIGGIKWVDTGDLGYIDSRGNVFISGRKKRMIVRPDGHNVFPVAIEQVISEHPDVDGVAVIGVANDEGDNGKIPAACITFKKTCQNVKRAVEDIKEISYQKLPPRDVALKYFVVDEIPMTEAGKVDYRKLEQMYSG